MAEPGPEETATIPVSPSQAERRVLHQFQCNASNHSKETTAPPQAWLRHKQATNQAIPNGWFHLIVFNTAT